MPNPLLPFDSTKPGDTDAITVYPALDRSDKTSIAKVLGTLNPTGAPTTAWRVVQIGNLVVLAQNASYQGGQWVVDDTSVIGQALIYDAVDNIIAFGWSPLGVSPFANWQTLAQIAGVANTVNCLKLTGQVTGTAPTLSTYGADPNIGINVVTKGTGTLQLNGQPVAQTGTGYLRLGPITLQWGAQTVTVATTNTWASAHVTFPVAFSASVFVVTAGLNNLTSAQATAYLNPTATGFDAYVISANPGPFLYNWMAVGAT